MPLGEFRSKYSGDVNALVIDGINQRLLAAKVMQQRTALSHTFVNTSCHLMSSNKPWGEMKKSAIGSAAQSKQSKTHS